jgi:hypothetical protein
MVQPHEAGEAKVQVDWGGQLEREVSSTCSPSPLAAWSVQVGHWVSNWGPRKSTSPSTPPAATCRRKERTGGPWDHSPEGVTIAG